MIDRIYPIHYIPIDHKDRDVQLLDLSIILEQRIKVNWDNLVGHDDPKNPDWKKTNTVPDLDWDFIYSLPMIKRFYSK